VWLANPPLNEAYRPYPIAIPGLSAEGSRTVRPGTLLRMLLGELRYFRTKLALIFDPSSAVMVTTAHVPGFFGVDQFWMN